jgi:phosphoribosylformylglycinamidine synthase subunit PurL
VAIKSRRGKLYPPVERDFAFKLGLDEVEWEKIVDRLGRNPNHFECTIFATLWSDEVSNKSSASLLESVAREQPEVIKIPGSRLGLICIGEDQYLALRIVHNNKQTGKEPYWGVQTALDISLSDLTSAGGRPIGLLNSLKIGSTDLIKNQRLLQNASDGIGAYGNKFGTPILGGDLYFHKNYNKSPLINSAVAGLVETSHAIKKSTAPFKSPVLYVGAPTGRDGLISQNKSGLSSQTLTVSDPLLCSRMICAISEAVEAKYVSDVVCVGSGGIAMACFDLSSRVNKPMLLDIDKIPLRKNTTMEPLEIILSESTERLLVVANKEKHRELVDVFHKWEISSVRVGEINDSEGIEFYWNHYIAADIPFQFAISGSVQKQIEVVKFPPMLKRRDASSEQAQQARKKRHVVDDEWSLVREVSISKQAQKEKDKDFACPKNLEDVWLDMLANPNLCSRKPLYQMFDQILNASTVIQPGGDASVIRLKTALNKQFTAQFTDTEHPFPNRGLALTLDSNPLYVSMEPYLGTVQTVAEAMRNLAASGARVLAMTHCMNFGDPNNYKEICDLAESIRGLGDAAKIWDIPVLGETISLYNGTEGSPILPTPVVFMAGIVKDVTKIPRAGFSNKGDVILLLGLTKNEIGCSEYANYTHKTINHHVPDINFEEEKVTCELIVELIEMGLISSAHDISTGGSAIALVESCLERESPIGATLKIDDQVFETPNGPVPLRRDSALFSESSGRFLISCKPENEDKIRQLCKEHSILITGSGVVGGKDIAIKGVVDVELPLSTVYRLWTHRLGHLMGRKED